MFQEKKIKIQSFQLRKNPNITGSYCAFNDKHFIDYRQDCYIHPNLKIIICIKCRNESIKPIERTKVCQVCGQEYTRDTRYTRTQMANSKYCSYQCGTIAKKRKAHDKPRDKKICKQCNKQFFRNKKFDDNQWKGALYCSIKCSGDGRRKYRNNKERQEIIRRKNGISKFGSEEHKLKISALTKIAMYRPEVQEKIRQPKGSPTLEQRIAQSNKLAGRMPKNLMMPNNGHYPNVKRGYYDINGTTFFFRSKWESNYALYLDFLIDHKKIIKWEYESDTFMFEQIKLGTRSYTPDFKVFNLNGTVEYHEIKGYMDSRSKTKLKRIAKYYPEVMLLLIERRQYTEIINKLKGLIKFY